MNSKESTTYFGSGNKAIRYWQDLAVANRKVAEDAQAQRDKLEAHIKEVRLEAHNAALERAATLCENYPTDTKSDAMVANDCATLIRAMKVD